MASKLTLNMAFYTACLLVSFASFASEVSCELREFVIKKQYQIRSDSIDFGKAEEKIPNKLLLQLEQEKTADKVLNISVVKVNGEDLIEILYKSRLVSYVSIKLPDYHVVSVGYSIY